MFPGDTSFEQIVRSIFRVETSWCANKATATGFVVGRMRDSTQLIIAAAGHVLDFPKDETVSWKVQQFDETGKVEREQLFATNQKLKGDVPYRTHKKLDVGLCILPSFDKGKNQFARDNEQPVQMIARDPGVSTGTRVAWAGFPGIVEDVLGFSQLCYFEGVVSAMINRADGRDYYVVDGHAAWGVSGGPMWNWSEERDRLEVVGIVSKYQAESGLPGFCLFEPINAAIRYLQHWQKEEQNDELIILQ